MRALDAIATRRSIRRFAPREVSPAIVRELIAAAVAAPAPHHSRPWRFVEVGPEARPRLIEAMAVAWRADAASDGLSDSRIEGEIRRSRKQMADAPLLLLACIELGSARSWPDDRRRAAERDMYMQSLGAALQNLLLAAHVRGLGGYLKGAPLFCPAAVAEALALPDGWQPAFLVLLGYPAEGAGPPARPDARVDDFLVSR
ncbi:MAG: nitroreductase family protein [Dehalococcoidia bacterium]|nr:nitroreductase family protein [Dehalococcoidia bacterium]